MGFIIHPSGTSSMRGSRNFRQGGPGQTDKKKLWQRFFFYIVLSLFYRSQMGDFKEIYHFQGSRGGPNFSRGGPLFFQGVQLLIPYRNPYNLWFSRGGGVSGPPVPPLDPHLSSVITQQALQCSSGHSFLSWLILILTATLMSLRIDFKLKKGPAPLRNFADIYYLKEQSKLRQIRDVCTL